ncbi:oligosaccharide flippase family protein, partial [Enterococcus faecium]|nr:oligosaccharide flippase family protein [Enterococcus faecium]
MGILLKKYNSLSEPAKASIWFTLCNVLQKGILFLTTPIFTRMLSTAEYGKYTIFISWYSIIAIFTTLNLSAGVYNKGLIKYENKYALTSSFLGLSSFISLCALMLYLPFRTVINGLLDLSTEFVILILIESIFEPAFLLWSVKERFDYKYQKLVLITVLMAVLNPGLGIILILSFGEYAIWRVRAYVVVNVVVGMFIGIGILAKGKKLFDKE